MHGSLVGGLPPISDSENEWIEKEASRKGYIGELGLIIEWNGVVYGSRHGEKEA